MPGYARIARFAARFWRLGWLAVVCWVLFRWVARYRRVSRTAPAQQGRKRLDLWRVIGLAIASRIRLSSLSVELLPLIAKPLLQGALGALYSSEAIDEIVRRTKEHYRVLEPTIQRQPTVGGDLMVRLAASTIAIYRTLVALGHDEEHASRLVSDVVWRAYSRMGEIPWTLSRRVGRGPHGRLSFSIDAFLTFPFSTPSYRWQRVDAGDGVVAFDMIRCPVADYFNSQGLAGLCVQTWCNQDFALASRWGGATLERTETLAGGAGRCDFRWRARGPLGRNLDHHDVLNQQMAHRDV